MLGALNDGVVYERSLAFGGIASDHFVHNRRHLGGYCRPRFVTPSVTKKGQAKRYSLGRQIVGVLLAFVFGRVSLEDIA